jgi:hypothetical protein
MEVLLKSAFPVARDKSARRRNDPRFRVDEKATDGRNENMKTFSVALPSQDSVPVLVSPLLEAIDGKRIFLRHHKDHGDPLISYGLLHRRAARALLRALQATAKYEAERKAENYQVKPQGSPNDAMDAFMEAVYRVAELFEFYDTDLLGYVESLNHNHGRKRVYKEAIKAIAKPWEILCNRCKHNHAYLVPVEGSYEDGSWVFGFSLYEWKDGWLQVDRTLHRRGSEAFSYNGAFRRLFASILRADLTAAQAVKETPDDLQAPEVHSHFFNMPYAEVIRAFTERAPYGMPKEIVEDHERFEQDLWQGQGTGAFTMHLMYECLSARMQMYAPYTGNELRALFHPDGNQRTPLPIATRFIHSDLKVLP